MGGKKTVDLKSIYKKEKDPKVRSRLLAVHMVCKCNDSIQSTAERLMQCPNWVSNCVRKYKEGGIDALRDLPRSGRPPKMPRSEIKQAIEDTGYRTTPVMLQKALHEKSGHKYHITHVRRIIRSFNLSPKRSQFIHINHASKSSVYRWQHNLRAEISRLEEEEFTILVMDEAFFTHDAKRGRMYWTIVGSRDNIPYTGNHKKIAVFGAVANNGRQMFRTYDKFNSKTFLAYLKELHRNFGKIFLICDRAPPHTSKMLKKYVSDHPDIRICYLPKGSPYLNVIEQCWNIGKKQLLVSKYYETFDRMCNVISNYFRVVRFEYDVFKHLYASPHRHLKNI